MGFWQNVQDEISYRNISRKELASAANFSVNTISTGIKRDGMPEADLALRIARVLDLPLEKLLGTENDVEYSRAAEDIQRQSELIERYIDVIQKLDKLPCESAKAIITIIDKLSV